MAWFAVGIPAALIGLGYALGGAEWFAAALFAAVPLCVILACLWMFLADPSVKGVGLLAIALLTCAWPLIAIYRATTGEDPRDG